MVLVKKIRQIVIGQLEKPIIIKTAGSLNQPQSNVITRETTTNSLNLTEERSGFFLLQ